MLCANISSPKVDCYIWHSRILLSTKNLAKAPHMPIFDLLHALLIGTMCYQFIFMLLQWYVFRRKDYLYYITYMGCTLLFLLIRIDGNSPFLPIRAANTTQQVYTISVNKIIEENFVFQKILRKFTSSTNWGVITFFND